MRLCFSPSSPPGPQFTTLIGSQALMLFYMLKLDTSNMPKLEPQEPSSMINIAHCNFPTTGVSEVPISLTEVQIERSVIFLIVLSFFSALAIKVDKSAFMSPRYQSDSTGRGLWDRSFGTKGCSGRSKSVVACSILNRSIFGRVSLSSGCFPCSQRFPIQVLRSLSAVEVYMYSSQRIDGHS
ncbi:hypothetical protein ABKN59_011662 [Abortiporus biennis]